MMPKLQKKFKTILFVFVASRIKSTALKLDPSAVSFVVNNKNYVYWLCEKLTFLQQNPSTTWSTLLWNTKSWDAATIKNRTDNMKSSVQSNLSVSFHFLLWRKRHIKAHAKVWSVSTIKVLKEIWCGCRKKDRDKFS